MSNLRPAVSDVHRSLSELSDLDAATRGKVLRKLHADGYLVDDRAGKLFAAAETRRADAVPVADYLITSASLVRLQTPLQAAADPANERVLRLVTAQCKRVGYDLQPNSIVDVDALNSALAKSPDVALRMAVKTTMHRLHLIP